MKAVGIRLKTNLMAKGTATSLRIGSVNIEMLDSFYLLGSTSNSKVTSNQEICQRPTYQSSNERKDIEISCSVTLQKRKLDFEEAAQKEY